MEFLVTRLELLLIFQISKSASHDLNNDGSLTHPINWCGSGKRFCLRLAANEFAKLNNLTPPSDQTIIHYWNSIISIRDKKEEVKLAKKSAKVSS
jgi:hypothetical protein